MVPIGIASTGWCIKGGEMSDRYIYNPQRPLGDHRPDEYMESPRDYVLNIVDIHYSIG
jgi:hypothetical protein